VRHVKQHAIDRGIQPRPDHRAVQVIRIQQRAGDAFYTIPDTWYETKMGGLWLRAFVRLQGDELITITEAARLASVTVAAMSERIAKGKLPAYPDPNEPNPQRRQRVRRSDVTPADPS